MRYLTLKRLLSAPRRDPQANEVRVYADAAGALRTVQPDGTDAAVAGAGALPDGGTTGQVLTKASDANGDADWENGAGGSRSISLSDTAATLSKSQVFDSRGVGAIGLYSDVDASSTDSVQTLVFTRKTGKPWMTVPTLEMSAGVVLPSVTTLWPLSGFSNAEWMDSFSGLLDESVVVVQPGGLGGANKATGATTDASVTFQVGGAICGGDFGNAFTVTLIDPGVPDSPLSLSSPDGYDFVISLATDGMGAITTTSDEIEGLVIGQTGGGGLVAQAWVMYCINNGSVGALVPEVIPMTGGTSGATGATYEVSGTY